MKLKYGDNTQAHEGGQMDPQPFQFSVGTYHSAQGQARGKSAGQAGNKYYSQLPSQ